MSIIISIISTFFMCISPLSSLAQDDYSDSYVQLPAINKLNKRGIGTASGVPHIDEMASEWLDVNEIVHMPSLHNFHEMGACSPELLGVNYIPGGQLYAGSGERWYEYNTLPLVKLVINGKTHKAQRSRWFPYQAVRSSSFDHLQVTTTVRMGVEAPKILYRAEVRNNSNQARSIDVAFDMPGILDNTEEGRVAVYQSLENQMTMVHAPVSQPNLFLQKNDNQVSMG